MEKPLTGPEIREMYKNGRRDFSGINAKLAELGGADLRGAIFKNANLSWANLGYANLSDTDFSEANLTWSDLPYAILTSANFRKAILTWTNFSHVFVDKTDFTKANISCSLIVDTNFSAAKTKETDFTWSIRCISDFTEEDMKFCMSEIRKFGGKIPADILEGVRNQVREIHQQAKEARSLLHPSSSQKQKQIGYSIEKNLQKKLATTYANLRSIYSSAMEYGQKEDEMKHILGQPAPKKKLLYRA